MSVAAVVISLSPSLVAIAEQLRIDYHVMHGPPIRGLANGLIFPPVWDRYVSTITSGFSPVCLMPLVIAALLLLMSQALKPWIVGRGR